MKNTDYHAIETYRMEQHPEKRRAETLYLLSIGTPARRINSALGRKTWIDKDLSIIERCSIREREEQECKTWLSDPKVTP